MTAKFLATNREDRTCLCQKPDLPERYFKQIYPPIYLYDYLSLRVYPANDFENKAFQVVRKAILEIRMDQERVGTFLSVV